MNEADLFKEYFGTPQSLQTKAKSSLLLMMLKLTGYNQVGDLGIAGILIFQSRHGKYLYIKRW